MQLSRFWLPVLLLILLAGCSRQGTFGPLREETTADPMLSRGALQVSLGELDGSPQTYRNRLVRVTGAYRPLVPPPCETVRGPAPRWALVNEGLNLYVVGFGPIMALVPEGTLLTVDGFWRLYQGPVGCGKEPSAETVWYLEAVRLVEPNPLPGLSMATVEPGADQLATPPLAETPSLPGTPPAGTPSPSATLRTVTPGATPTLDLNVTPSVTPTDEVTATFTPTPEPGTPSATPDEETPSPTPTISGGNTPTSPAPTDTPSGYPGPPDPTATPPPY